MDSKETLKLKALHKIISVMTPEDKQAYLEKHHPVLAKTVVTYTTIEKPSFQFVKYTPTTITVENVKPKCEKTKKELLELEKQLTYFDKGLFNSQKRILSGWQGRQVDLKKLKAECTFSLLKKVDDFTYEFPAGLYESLNLWDINVYGVNFSNKIVYPPLTPENLAVELPFKQREFQLEAAEKLSKEKHAAVSLATGMGKTSILLSLAASHGLKTVVVTPSSEISQQIYDLFCTHLGKEKVGKFFGVKKTSTQKFIVANGQSLMNIEKGNEHFDNLSSAQVVLFDESHRLPAETFQRVAYGLLSSAPYRYSFSATQFRNDGLTTVLTGITGPVVLERSVLNGVDEGFLCPLEFTFNLLDGEKIRPMNDVMAETRKFLYQNKIVHKHAAIDAAFKSEVCGESTLVLIDEMNQFNLLLPYLKDVSFLFAHGGKAHSSLPENFHNPNNKEIVEKFNSGQCKLLIGTQTLCTGVDLRPTQNIFYLKGGCSEIDFYQSIGRGTRLHPSKKVCKVYDYGVLFSPACERHSKIRLGFMNQMSRKNITSVKIG
jgi:superfamily II DNA or RNA helicase